MEPARIKLDFEGFRADTKGYVFRGLTDAEYHFIWGVVCDCGDLISIHLEAFTETVWTYKVKTFRTAKEDRKWRVKPKLNVQEAMSADDFSEHLNNPFQIMDFGFFYGCSVCSEWYACRLSPCRPCDMRFSWRSSGALNTIPQRYRFTLGLERSDCETYTQWQLEPAIQKVLAASWVRAGLAKAEKIIFQFDSSYCNVFSLSARLAQFETFDVHQHWSTYRLDLLDMPEEPKEAWVRVCQGVFDFYKDEGSSLVLPPDTDWLPKESCGSSYVAPPQLRLLDRKRIKIPQPLQRVTKDGQIPGYIGDGTDPYSSKRRASHSPDDNPTTKRQRDWDGTDQNRSKRRASQSPDDNPTAKRQRDWDGTDQKRSKRRLSSPDEGASVKRQCVRSVRRRLHVDYNESDESSDDSRSEDSASNESLASEESDESSVSSGSSEDVDDSQGEFEPPIDAECSQTTDLSEADEPAFIPLPGSPELVDSDEAFNVNSAAIGEAEASWAQTRDVFEFPSDEDSECPSV